MLLLTGPLGAGKSSFAQAGLIGIPSVAARPVGRVASIDDLERRAGWECLGRQIRRQLREYREVCGGGFVVRPAGAKVRELRRDVSTVFLLRQPAADAGEQEAQKDVESGGQGDVALVRPSALEAMDVLFPQIGLEARGTVCGRLSASITRSAAWRSGIMSPEEQTKMRIGLYRLVRPKRSDARRANLTWPIGCGAPEFSRHK